MRVKYKLAEEFKQVIVKSEIRKTFENNYVIDVNDTKYTFHINDSVSGASISIDSTTFPISLEAYNFVEDQFKIPYRESIENQLHLSLNEEKQQISDQHKQLKDKIAKLQTELEIKDMITKRTKWYHLLFNIGV